MVLRVYGHACDGGYARNEHTRTIAITATTHPRLYPASLLRNVKKKRGWGWGWGGKAHPQKARKTTDRCTKPTQPLFQEGGEV